MPFHGMARPGTRHQCNAADSRSTAKSPDAPEHVARALRVCYNLAAAKKRVDAPSGTVEELAKRFFVSGRVQGVGFRYFAEQQAGKLGVNGYVRNLSDGRVEVYAIGDSRQMEALRAVLTRGPRMSQVHRVDEEDVEVLRNFAFGFFVESDG
jgi:acylphosphatase